MTAALPKWGAELPARCAVTAIIENRGRVLWNLRDDKPDIWAPNTWSLIGGQVENGETLYAAIVREVEEETGLRLGGSRCCPVWPVLEYRGEAQKVSIAFAVRVPDADADSVVCGEGREMRWVSPVDFIGDPLAHSGHNVITAHHALALHWFAIAKDNLC